MRKHQYMDTLKLEGEQFKMKTQILLADGIKLDDFVKGTRKAIFLNSVSSLVFALTLIFHILWSWFSQ